MKVFILSLTLIVLGMSSAASGTFYSDLYHAIAKDQTSKNIIFSPVSIKTCLGLAYLGAEGETANEIQKGIKLSGSSKQAVGEEFSKLLGKSDDEGEFKFHIVNRLYVDQKYEISKEFNDLSSKYFGSTAESVKFAEATKTAATINAWVEANTENKIQQLIDPTSLDEYTASVLVNAIYFKAKWLNTFDTKFTKKNQFQVDKTRNVEVDMMHHDDRFLYGELPELDATALELKYYKTDLSMMILLPKNVDGLASLEDKLKSTDLTTITDKLSSQRVNVQLPKFKIEFDLSLEPALKQLGMSKMFTDAADFSSLLSKKEPMRISEAKHKAFIEVTEVGTEAAAATYFKIYPLSADLSKAKDFIADHPFFFAIKDAEHVYFAGHVANF